MKLAEAAAAAGDGARARRGAGAAAHCSRLLLIAALAAVCLFVVVDDGANFSSLNWPKLSPNNKLSHYISLQHITA